MSTQPIKDVAGLPREGEPVEFVLEGHEVALNGTYVENTFRSRHSGYAVERVSSWRSVDATERSSIPDAPTVNDGSELVEPNQVGRTTTDPLATPTSGGYAEPSRGEDHEQELVS